jgi:hypothetical protein
MAARAEVLGDRTIGGKEPLRMTGRLKLLHAPLALACRLVRVFCTVIEIPMLPMFHTRKKLSLGGSVALEFIGDEHARDVGQAPEELAEELLRRQLVAPALYQDVKHVPALIHRPPQIVTFTFESEHHLFEVPLVAGPRTPATELIGIRLAKLVTPLADGLIRHLDATFTQELFHIPDTQTESKVLPDGVADNLHRKAVILIFGGSQRCVHALITS